MDQLELVSTIFSVSKTIYEMVENMKTNKERCQRVAQRVKSLEELVLSIKQRGPGQVSPAVVKALNDLWITLISTKGLMNKYSQTKAFKSFLKSKSHEEKFYEMNERLTDHFQVLSGVLQVEHGNMLCKVYDSVSGIRHNEELPPTSPTALMPHLMPTPSSPPALPLANPTPFMHLPMPVPHPTSPTHSFAGPRPMFIPPMTRQYSMPCMQVSSPTALMPHPMPTPSSPPALPLANPTPFMHLPMPVPHPMPTPSSPPALPLANPTPFMHLPMPVPHPMPTPSSPPALPLANPTPFMHLPMPVPHPTSPTHSFAGPRPVFITRQYSMPCMQVSSPTNPMTFIRTMAPYPSPHPQCVPATMSSFHVFPATATMAQMPLNRPDNIMTVLPQNTSTVTCVVKSFLR